jgi:hypothetical protein
MCIEITIQSVAIKLVEACSRQRENQSFNDLQFTTMELQGISTLAKHDFLRNLPTLFPKGQCFLNEMCRMEVAEYLLTVKITS